MLYSVKIIASDIQVSSADNDDEAEGYARDDAREFYADWNYLASEIAKAPAGAEATTEDDDLVFDVTQTDYDEGEGLYTFDVEYTLVVEAESEEEASDLARFFYATEKYGPREFDADVGPKALSEISDLDRATRPSDISSIAYHALCKMSAKDPAFATLEKIMNTIEFGADNAGALAIDMAEAHMTQRASMPSR